MKRWIVFCALALLLFTGCAKRPTFTAEVESVGENTLIVATVGYQGFDRAAVKVNDRTRIQDKDGQTVSLSDIRTGDTLLITIRPEVSKSLPVQVTAVSITIKARHEGETMEPAQYKKISPAEAKGMMGNTPAPIILDVRTAEEYATGHIRGSILLPDTEIEGRSAMVIPDKYATILIYCRSGRRSEIAAKKLINMGYTAVYDFGGIIDWPYGTVTE